MFPSSPPIADRETRRLRIAMGTWIAFEVTARSPLVAQQSIELAFDSVRQVERLMHPQRAGSDLAALNAAELHATVRVDPDTWAVLSLAQQISFATDGVFDPCLPSQPGRIADLELGPDRTTVTCHARVALDLGGIAKGYAVDRAVETLRRCGCDSGLVNAGGDLRVFGRGFQTIFLKSTDPENEQSVEFRPLDLKDTALAVSEVNADQRPPEHRGYYVRNSNQPRPSCRYAAVLASQAAVADALAKCVLLCSKETADRALRQFGAARAVI